ncbi:hypothetical protein SCHPADRAFT_479126 [Schizopora paradoxa]|uniref:Uncharacterized protein n=1 Tax=Schizopora paradoxa TaxID=27342 RepID=A0A0H2S2P5_9AGAM|nr:hypothetical protein SCHPADRAFT_479126 [Schizopora paradoxa]
MSSRSRMREPIRAMRRDRDNAGSRDSFKEKGGFTNLASGSKFARQRKGSSRLLVQHRAARGRGQDDVFLGIFLTSTRALRIVRPGLDGTIAGDLERRRNNALTQCAPYSRHLFIPREACSSTVLVHRRLKLPRVAGGCMRNSRRVLRIDACSGSGNALRMQG